MIFTCNVCRWSLKCCVTRKKSIKNKHNKFLIWYNFYPQRLSLEFLHIFQRLLHILKLFLIIFKSFIILSNFYLQSLSLVLKVLRDSVPSLGEAGGLGERLRVVEQGGCLLQPADGLGQSHRQTLHCLRTVKHFFQIFLSFF